jgi:hypothetical protein
MKGLKVCFPLVGLMLSSNILAVENPMYAEESESLTIPVADGASGAGIYQDVVFEVDGDIWRLTSGNIGIEVSEISSVELIQVESSPVQVFLEVSGTFLSGCPEIGNISHRLVENEFEVFVYYTPFPEPGTVGCTQALVDFSEIIPLPVYGLDAGDYTYMVNESTLTENNSGVFSLATKNTL